MIWLFNTLLVLLGLPLLGTTFLLIGHIFIDSNIFSTSTEIIYSILFWTINLAVLIYIYINRTNWLENYGILKSWSMFRTYVLEHHSIAIDNKSLELNDFNNWLKTMDYNDNTKCEDVYSDIKYENIDNSMKIKYLKCLAWCMLGNCSYIN